MTDTTARLEKAHAQWADADEALSMAALRSLCEEIRAVAPTATHFHLGQSDQGDWAYLQGVYDASDTDLSEDLDFDEAESHASNLDDRAQRYFMLPGGIVRSGGYDRRMGYDVYLDIDKCLELTEPEETEPVRVEVHTLVVDPYGGPLATMAFGTEAEVYQALRERYAEGLPKEATDQELLDFLTDEPGGYAVYIDASMVTLP